MEEKINALRAWSYNAAVKAGLDLQSYAWSDIPVGTWTARLDFKVWSNKTSTGHLVCYFTSLVDERRYRLSAFRPSSGSRRYTPKDGSVDFSTLEPDGKTFLISVGKTSKGGATWLAAGVVDSI